MLGRSGAWLQSTWDAARASYWFVPGLMMGFAALLAVGVTELDRRLSSGIGLAAPWLFARNGDVVRDVLVTIAGSMMTVTGVVFSITIVALTLASSQFGPRLLRTFMYDRGNQFVLGTFLATFVYCLLTLRVVGVGRDGEFVPYLAGSVAIVLALVSLVVLIYFIHHIASSLQVTTIAAEVSREIEEAIEVLYPEEMGEEPSSPREDLPASLGEPIAIVRAARGGHVRILGEADLLEVAAAADVVVRLRRQPGDFVPARGVLAEVHTAGGSRPCAAERGEMDAADLCRSIKECFALGAQRTPAQDIRFLLNQLNDIALRALSPGINDPRTARLCIRYLGSALGRLGARQFPGPHRFDQDGRLRVVATAATFDDLLRGCFDSIRIAGRGFPDVAIELLDTLAEIAQQVRGDTRRAELVAVAKEVGGDALASLEAPMDRQRVEAKVVATAALLNGQQKNWQGG